MAERRALVVRTPSAARAQESGASLRVDDVVGLLAATGHDVTLTTAAELVNHRGRYDLGVAVSYVCTPSLRRLRRQCSRTWLDAVDSWVQVNWTGLRAGHAPYAARAARDAVNVLTASPPDLVTWISGADRAADRGTVRGRLRLVLPGQAPDLHVPQREEARLVLAGDWDYPPNRVGLRWFTRRVLPLLPAPVHVFGRGRVRVAPGLVSHGHVLDPRELFGSRDIHLAPVSFGGGVKRKVLQPLLAGLPVVTTTAGAHGLRRHPLLRVADRAGDFATAACDLLANPPQRQEVDPQEVYDADDRVTVMHWLDQGFGLPASRRNRDS